MPFGITTQMAMMIMPKMSRQNSSVANRSCRPTNVKAPTIGPTRLWTPPSSTIIKASIEREMLTVALTGRDGGRCTGLVDYLFAVPSHNILRIQETHLTLYHALWDMVHTLLHYEPELRRADTTTSIPPVAESMEVDANLSQLYPFLFDR